MPPRPLPAIVLIVLLVVTTSAQTAPPASPTRIAVINTAHLLSSLDEMADAQRAIEAMRSAAQKEIDRRKAEIERLSADLDNPNLYKRDSPEFRKLQEDLLQKSLDLQSFTQFSQQKLFMELRLRTLLVTRNRLAQPVALGGRRTRSGVAVRSRGSCLDLGVAAPPEPKSCSGKGYDGYHRHSDTDREPPIRRVRHRGRLRLEALCDVADSNVGCRARRARGQDIAGEL